MTLEVSTLINQGYACAPLESVQEDISTLEGSPSSQSKVLGHSFRVHPELIAIRRCELRSYLRLLRGDRFAVFMAQDTFMLYCKLILIGYLLNTNYHEQTINHSNH